MESVATTLLDTNYYVFSLYEQHCEINFFFPTTANVIGSLGNKSYKSDCIKSVSFEELLQREKTGEIAPES